MIFYLAYDFLNGLPAGDARQAGESMEATSQCDGTDANGYGKDTLDGDYQMKELATVMDVPVSMNV